MYTKLQVAAPRYLVYSRSVISWFNPNFVDWSVAYEKGSGVWNFDEITFRSPRAVFQ